MNYSEHNKFPNHDAVSLPCIVYVAVIDNYYLFSVDAAHMPTREQIPRELGEWFKELNEYTTLMPEMKEALPKEKTPVRFQNIFRDRQNYPKFKITGNLISRV